MPQGSTLGPLLFLININNLHIHTKFSVRMFTHDTVLCIKNQNRNKLEKIVSTELLRITDWTRFNTLLLSFTKTYYMIIPNSKRKHKTNNFKISICGNTWKNWYSSLHYLRLDLQSNLNFKTHSYRFYVYK